jgi:predicted dehydrogenase
MPRVRAVKDSLDRRQLGEPGLLRIHRWVAAREDDLGLLPWLAREIDLALWLLGEPVAAHAAARPGYAQLHLGFAGGGMALIDGCRALPAGQGYFSLSLIGSTGAAYADDHHDMQLLFAGGDATALLTGQGDAELLAMCQALVSALEQGRQPPVSAGDAVRALRLAETTPSDPSARVEP